MNRPLISIIIPVFNVKKYLPECLESVVSQTYSNLEIVLVDDGSDDGSETICDDFSSKDNRIRVIHKKNGGLSDARNAGVSEARGEWIFFVDADDYIARDACEKLIFTAMNTSADIVIGEERKFDDCDKIKISKQTGIKDIITSDETLIQYFYRKISGYVCGRLYKDNLVKNIIFPVGRYFEDVFVLYKILEKASKIVVLYDEVYYYRQRAGSIINSQYSVRQLDIIAANEEIKQHYSNGSELIKNAISSRCFVSGVDVLRKIPLNRELKQDKEYVIRVIKETRKMALLDKNNNVLIRGMAAIAFISPRALGVLAKGRYLIKVKRI
ncbi:glycosyltransferase family 2 protein [Clostridium sp. C105KSO13]|uniref:glycosyltransferase family 2 protein n=1 Tax=Clostridium sp. C105KSO13 TaxID=1776045 RepID=UPI0007406469|nr:glycosyltransferase family 2 protein [Clostridium sp. C105KSO13]CUX34408.1 putative glycosyltransferase EpsJ [Clostridium sp. C105KSO13]